MRADRFGNLLRHWRTRRRISQLDLALAANVSSRHISFLETGRSRPSRDMVLQLSEVMDVPRAERNALLAAAGFVAAYAARDPGAEELRFVREAVAWTLERHDPYPGIALDRHWRIVAANRSANGLLAPLQISIGDSLLEAFLEPGPFRAALGNWPSIARQMLVRLRTESAHLGGDSVLDDAIQRIAGSGEFEQGPASPDYPAIIPVEWRGGDGPLRFFSIISQFGSTDDIALADLRIELMFPADDATRAALCANMR